jgi:hypothetical protein
MCYKILIPKHGLCSRLWSNHSALYLAVDNTTLRHYNKNEMAKATTQNNFAPHCEGQMQFQRVHQHFFYLLSSHKPESQTLWHQMSSICNMLRQDHNTRCQPLTMVRSYAGVTTTPVCCSHTAHLIAVITRYFLLLYHTGHRPLEHTI